MYYMLECFSPLDVQKALIDYTADRPPGEIFKRNWKKGQRFASAPAEPVRATIPASQAGVVLEVNLSTLPLMSRRLADAVRAAGVDNIEFYEAEIADEASGAVLRDHLAFNLVGTVAAADLAQSKFTADDGPLITVSFNSLVIAGDKARGALMFRLAESTMGIVVHESVRKVIEARGIDTLNFVPPAEWVS